MRFEFDSDSVFSCAEREWLRVPEQRLLFAMIERAVRDLSTGHENDARAAYSWLFDEVNSRACPRPFSFSWICECLEIDAHKLRAIIAGQAPPKVKQLGFPVDTACL